MRHVTHQLGVPNSVASGNGQPCADLTSKVVQVHGTFTATLAIEGRMVLPGGDVTPWEPIASVTARGFTAVPAVSEVRINVTAYTSGDPEAVLGGWDENG